ncbi:SMODS domain-containing nucleotidyltransferase [Anaerotignum lactatifermentans]|uniref:SMODS domain-containing nucleotidyltransferase n=1 Tax=Anaerotignum lactatifermentans TaxID=160404 RepID=UPI001873E83E|nr:nucleotidyltransferase [Anaerotignum lactatifermentans]MBE5076478.1 nucleotidyltransferase [Anaerotignum lactatifermentans]
MATTVNNAFAEFMKGKVNLDQEKTKTARSSRDNLIDNIKKFSGDADFFKVYKEKILRFGSFERRTKIRPIDDIDLMLCLSGEGTRTYIQSGDVFYISGNYSDSENRLTTDNTNFLNSTKVINRFISKLSDLQDYNKAEMHKNHEAATLQLKSYTWNFDIVPCFYTDTGFYLIPDGSGNWKKTDPRIDNERIIDINQKHNGKLLELIRLAKYWNNRKVTIRIGSYLLECMILQKYENQEISEDWWIDLEFRDLLNYLSLTILSDVDDPKGIQGNLNSFSWHDRCKISDALTNAYNKAVEASDMELIDNNQKRAITKWREVLGNDFPEYTGG